MLLNPFREQHKLALTWTEKGVGGPDAQLCKHKYLRVCSLRQRRLTGPQVAAALNIKHQCQHQQ